MSEPPSPPPRWSARLVIARLAWRDLRGGLAGLRLVLVCIALGVAAIVSVNSLARALEDGMARDGRTILGGDASFSLMQRELAPEERAFLARRGELSTIAAVRAMARNGAGDATLVEVKAVDAAWPRLGRAVFEPAMATEAALARHGDLYGAAVEEALLDRLGLKVGDSFALGAARLEARAKLVSEPDRLATGIGLGPRVLISQEALGAADLIQPGSLVRWTTRVLLGAGGAPPSEAAVAAFVDQAKAAFPRAGWEARTRSAVSPDFSRDLDRFGEYLALVGLISLVVGGVGVANAAQSFVERKRATLAILKALGASGGAVVALALIEFLAAALIGVGAGAAIGAATPFAVAALFSAVLPLPLAPAIYPGELALGALYGLMTAFVFAVAPLGRAHDIPVSQLFRTLVESRAARPRLRYLGEGADLGGVLRQVLLPPSVGHRPQQGDQRGGRGQNDILLHAGFDQRRVALQRGAEETFAGQEQDGEFGRVVELLPIGFAAQRRQVSAHLAGVVGKAGLARRFVGGFDGLQVAVERRFGVHHDGFSGRQADQQVGAQAAFVGADGSLCGEVAVVQHAGHLHHALQLDFTPASARAGRAQRSHQLSGFRA